MFKFLARFRRITPDEARAAARALGKTLPAEIRKAGKSDNVMVFRAFCAGYRFAGRELPPLSEVKKEIPVAVAAAREHDNVRELKHG